MALETNAFTTYSAIGNVEDVSDIIYNVDPTETPFVSMIDRVKAINTLHEWQTDVLDAASATNAQLQGDAYSAASTTATVRKSNNTQISNKQPRVTGTQRAVKHYGRGDELEYQLVKAGKALKNDIESTLLANNTKVTGNSTTAPECAGYESWVESNESRGSGGSSAGSGTAATDGTQRAFTEAQLKTVLQSCWDNGGNPDCIIVGGFNKQTISAFSGNATRFDKSEDKKLYASVDVYVSDFGDLNIVPCRHGRARSALVVQKEYWALAELRPIERVKVAKTGDSDAEVLQCEYTLEARNEKSSGIVADLNTS